MDATGPITEWLRGTFLRYQLRWILDDAPFAVALKGRQLGYTDASAGRCLLGALCHRRPQIVLSAAQDNANALLDAVRTHARFLARIGLPEAARFTVDNTEEVAWANGASVVALAANPRTARSFHGDVYFDEFAYHADAEAMWAAAAPMATRGDWRLRIISTPNGAAGKFYELCQRAEAGALGRGWSYHRVSLDDAERDGLRVDRERLLSLVGGDERVFGEAYLCQFLDADLQYLPTTLVDAALSWKGSTPDLSDAELFAGLDVGRTQDITALTPLATMRRIAWVLTVLTAKRTAFKAQRHMIERARETFGWRRLVVDASGLGTQLAEELVERWGEDEVIPLQFTMPLKATLATGVFRWLRDNRLRLPKDAAGRALRDEMVAVRRRVTNAGNVLYESPRTSQGHGDRFWSMALALLGASGPELPRGVGDSPLMAVA